MTNNLLGWSCSTIKVVLKLQYDYPVKDLSSSKNVCCSQKWTEIRDIHDLSWHDSGLSRIVGQRTYAIARNRIHHSRDTLCQASLWGTRIVKCMMSDLVAQWSFNVKWSGCGTNTRFLVRFITTISESSYLIMMTMNVSFKKSRTFTFPLKTIMFDCRQIARRQSLFFHTKEAMSLV